MLVESSGSGLVLHWRRAYAASYNENSLLSVTGITLCTWRRKRPFSGRLCCVLHTRRKTKYRKQIYQIWFSSFSRLRQLLVWIVFIPNFVLFSAIFNVVMPIPVFPLLFLLLALRKLEVNWFCHYSHVLVSLSYSFASFVTNYFALLAWGTWKIFKSSSVLQHDVFHSYVTHSPLNHVL